MSLLRTIGSRIYKHAANAIRFSNARPIHHLSFHGESDEDIENKFIDFFNKADIDGWEVRQGMNDILALDMVPDPCVVISVMYACRRVNDYAIAVRFLEAVKDKCGNKCSEIYPYVIQEIAPVLCELGIDTPETLGYDRPELCLQNVFDIH